MASPRWRRLALIVVLCSSLDSLTSQALDHPQPGSAKAAEASYAPGAYAHPGNIFRPLYPHITALVLLFLAAIAGMLWIYRQRLGDVDALKQALFEARKLRIAVDQSPASIVITDCDGNIEYVNSTCLANTGYSREELIGSNPRLLQSGRTPKAVYVDLWATIKAGRTWQGRIVNRRKDGSEYVERVLINPVLDEQDQPIRFIAVKEDITALEQLDQRLQSLERFDALTGLANRFSFFEALDQRLLQILGPRMRQALLLVNIRRFRSFNAAHGHEAGDRLLQQMAQRLLEHAPPGALVARIGPDEFAVLPPLEASSGRQTRSDSDVQWIQRIQRALREDYQIDCRTLVAAAAIGVAYWDRPSHAKLAPRSGEFMQMADSALRAAKDNGDGQVAFFDAESSREAQQAFRLEQDLARALERKELHIELQAQVTPDGQLAGAEVLCRWQHASLGAIPPTRFIPLAEDSGQIVPIGYWVLDQAMAVLETLQAHDSSLSISVNISPIQIRRAEFVQALQDRLNQHSFKPSRLVLEITERVFLDDPELALERLTALRALGLGISIDDFGTGYSSLSYLKRLPVTELKIDRDFIAGLPHDLADGALVNVILSAASQLKLRVVAEGIETEAQALCFQGLKHVLLQGYLYDRPSPVPEWQDKWLHATLRKP
ncbi:MAG: putative bifunctional diguanylate cyclase/phosphodiesterase [Wenzhouxiangella sp.]